MKAGEIWQHKYNQKFPRLRLLEYRSNDTWAVELADGTDNPGYSPYKLISGEKLYENYYKVLDK